MTFGSIGTDAVFQRQGETLERAEREQFDLLADVCRRTNQHEDADDIGDPLVGERWKLGQLCRRASRHQLPDLLHLSADRCTLLLARLRQVDSQLAGRIDG